MSGPEREHVMRIEDLPATTADVVVQLKRIADALEKNAEMTDKVALRLQEIIEHNWYQVR